MSPTNIHEHMLLDPPEAHLRRLGTQPQRCYRVAIDDRFGFIDLFTVYRGQRIAIEAERSAARIMNDLIKASAASAALLVIIVPNHRIQRAINRHLHEVVIDDFDFELWVLPLGPAIYRIKKRFPICFPDGSRNQDIGNQKL